MLKFLCIFVLFNVAKIDTKLTLHRMGILVLLFNLTKIKIKNLEGYIFEKIFTIKNVWDEFPVFAQ